MVKARTPDLGKLSSFPGFAISLALCKRFNLSPLFFFFFFLLPVPQGSNYSSNCSKNKCINVTGTLNYRQTVSVAVPYFKGRPLCSYECVEVSQPVPRKVSRHSGHHHAQPRQRTQPGGCKRCLLQGSQFSSPARLSEGPDAAGRGERSSNSRFQSELKRSA